ncbi:MAG: lysylphosphatidylglycerol synthase transmembrane domain-containing protein [Terriglobia bacterium]|nr:lysylphosphatidylglycerol synthase transmembrane domain-containing protein [Terriglobia bacterium]
MKKHRWLVMAAVFALLVVLVYIQFRTLRSFQWSTLTEAFDSIRWMQLVLATVLIYGAYITRAFRWSVFLRPTKPATPAQMVPAQFIGFTSVAILGRLGEFVRPYLVARRQQVSFTSQLAIYTVERVFDLLAAAGIIAVTLTLSNSVQVLPHHEEFRRAGYLGIALALLLALIAVVIRFFGPKFADIVGRILGMVSNKAGLAVREKVLAFSHGLDAIAGWTELLLVLFYSFLTWGLIALGYVVVVHAFRVPELASIPAGQTILLMAASMFGSFAQLPAIGGGSQVAIIYVLTEMLRVGPEAATACALTLYLITFLTVIPAGLAFAQVEHVSLRNVAKASEVEEEKLEEAGSGGNPQPEIASLP